MMNRNSGNLALMKQSALNLFPHKHCDNLQMAFREGNMLSLSGMAVTQYHTLSNVIDS